MSWIKEITLPKKAKQDDFIDWLKQNKNMTEEQYETLEREEKVALTKEFEEKHLTMKSTEVQSDAKTEVGDGKEPNMYWVTSSNDFFIAIEMGESQYASESMEFEPTANTKEPGFNTYKEALAYAEGLNVTEPKTGKIPEKGDIHLYMIEDRITGVIYEAGYERKEKIVYDWNVRDDTRLTKEQLGDRFAFEFVAFKRKAEEPTTTEEKPKVEDVKEKEEEVKPKFREVLKKPEDIEYPADIPKIDDAAKMLLEKIRQGLTNIKTIQAMVDEIKSTKLEELGYRKEQAVVDEAIEKLFGYLKATEPHAMIVEDKILTILDLVKSVPISHTTGEKIKKLLEKYGAEAEKFLERSESQLGKEEELKKELLLIRMPKHMKESTLKKITAGVIDTAKAFFKGLFETFKGWVASLVSMEEDLEEVTQDILEEVK